MDMTTHELQEMAERVDYVITMLRTWKKFRKSASDKDHQEYNRIVLEYTEEIIIKLEGHHLKQRAVYVKQLLKDLRTRAFGKKVPESARMSRNDTSKHMKLIVKFFEDCKTYFEGEYRAAVQRDYLKGYA